MAPFAIARLKRVRRRSRCRTDDLCSGLDGPFRNCATETYYSQISHQILLERLDGPFRNCATETHNILSPFDPAFILWLDGPFRNCATETISEKRATQGRYRHWLDGPFRNCATETIANEVDAKPIKGGLMAPFAIARLKHEDEAQAGADIITRGLMAPFAIARLKQ